MACRLKQITEKHRINKRVLESIGNDVENMHRLNGEKHSKRLLETPWIMEFRKEFEEKELKKRV